MLSEQMSQLLSVDNFNGDDPVESEKSVSRMTLRQVLLTGLEDVVSFDRKFARNEQNADGTVTVFSEDCAGKWMSEASSTNRCSAVSRSLPRGPRCVWLTPYRS